MLQEFVAFAERKHNLPVAKLRIDNGGEYSSNEMKKWCTDKGIELGYTPSHTPSLNGESKRLNRSICEKVRAMLFNSKLPKNMWGEAARVAAYLINRSPRSGSDKTPYKLWYGKKPILRNLKVFGLRVFSKTTSYLKKLDSRSKEYIFIGYAEHGYRLFDPADSSVIVSRDVIFRENETVESLNSDEVRVVLDSDLIGMLQPPDADNEKNANEENVEDQQGDRTL